MTKEVCTTCLTYSPQLEPKEVKEPYQRPEYLLNLGWKKRETLCIARRYRVAPIDLRVTVSNIL